MSGYETFSSVFAKTLHYANIFDYPLTTDEISSFAITEQPFSRQAFDQWIKKNKRSLKAQYNFDGTYWSHKGRQALSTTREEKNSRAKDYSRFAKKQLSIFRYMFPWIQLCAITGSTAAKNTKRTDDIDIFIITSRNRAWVTRAAILAYLTVINKRKTTFYQQDGPVICLNHMTTTSQLRQKRQDLYIANEIARMNVLWSKKNILPRFLRENNWVGNHLANWYRNQAAEIDLSTAPTSLPGALKATIFVLSAPIKTPFILFSWALDYLDRVAQRLQQPTNAPNKLTYHQRDNRQWILREFKWSLQK